MHAIDYADKLRDSPTERELTKQLRSLPEEERYAFIVEMLDVQLSVALELANKCLRRRDLLIRLLETGIARVKDLSTIKYWLDELIPRLGVRRVIQILREQLDEHPFGVGSSFYFVLSHVNRSDQESMDAFHSLYELAKAKDVPHLPDLRSFFDACDSSLPTE